MAVADPTPSGTTSVPPTRSSSLSSKATSSRSISKMATTTKIKRFRDKLSPKPILDRKLLAAALDAASVAIKPGQLDDFYQLLHRQHYPPLTEFVERYRRNQRGGTPSGGGAKAGDDDDGSPGDSSASRSLPLRNAASAKPGKRNIRNLPKAFLRFLADPDGDFSTLTSVVETARTSADGTTTKLAVRLQDGHVVESVLMRHVSPHGSRATLCVSSQVGCAMGCTFCATGTMGIRGNLTSGEILEQLVHADRILASELVDGAADENAAPADRNGQNESSGRTRKVRHNHDLVRNVVFMGMGEPLNNYGNVVDACRALIDCRRWNLAHGRVTVSTVGVVPKMRQLTRDLPEVSLALSLHAPNQPMRTAIVPAAKAYPIEDLVDALDEHMMAATKRKTSGGDGAGQYSEEERKIASKQKRAMIEYVMLEGDTSSFECAHQLGKLCENRHLIVNLIPYNQTDIKDKLTCPSEEHMREFQRIVMSYGAFCFVRRTMGADIAGACGQLVVGREKQQEAAVNGSAVVDIEGHFPKLTSRDKSAAAALLTTRRSRKSKDEKSGESGEGERSLKVAADHDACPDSREDVLEDWVRPLAIATAVAASCFILTGVIFMTQRRR